MRLPHIVAALAAAVSLTAASVASAAEPTGRGANITPVKNIPYGSTSPGTDLEFHSYDIDGVQRRFAFAGTYKLGLQIIDITDPANATPAAVWDCGVSQGDPEVFTRPDLGDRVFVAYTHDTGYSFRANSTCDDEARALGINVPTNGYGTFIADVTDPYHPKTVSFAPFGQGSHNVTVHPSGRYLYNSNSDLITSPLPAVEITDITDLSNPQAMPELPLVTFPGLGTESHDIDFNADGTRAYVAALSHAEILDTTDPGHPTSIGKLFDPAINVWHLTEAITITDPILGKRDFLLAEDEVAGATGTGQCPNGGVHVYDITGDLEKAPVKVGYWNIDDVGRTEDGIGTCTAHVFQLHRKEQLMTIAYYNGGVRVVDLSGLVGVALAGTGVGMKQLGWYRFPDSDTWAVKAPFVDRKGFYLYGDDHRRGFDVYRYEPSGTVAPGSWLTPEQALQQTKSARLRGLELSAVCLLDTSDQGALRGAAARSGLGLASI